MKSASPAAPIVQGADKEKIYNRRCAYDAAF
jgi:hypothetical protein